MAKLTFDDSQKLAQELEGLIPNIRERRKPIIEKWLNIHGAWKGSYTRAFFKSDTFKHYIPYFRRAIERFVVRGAQMLLPSNEFFEVFPTREYEEDPESTGQAESVQAYLLFLLRKKIRIYSIAKQLLRSLALYGRAILRTGVKITTEDGKQRVWPTCRVVDPFMFMYWPENAASLEEAQIVVEDSFIPYEQYLQEVSSGRMDPIEETKLMDPTWPDYVTRRLQTSGLTEPKAVAPAGLEQPDKIKVASQWVFYSEVWINRGAEGWKVVRIVWNLEGGPKIVKELSGSFTRPMYRMTIAREIPGEQYTTSMGDDQEPMQILLNDQINMYLDGLAIQQAPPAAIDVNRITRANSLVYRQRALWRVDPDGVRWMDPKDTTKSSLQAINFTTGMMDSFSGSSPLAEGQPIRNLPRAGFAVSSLLSMSLADIRDVARSIEDDILTALLHDLYALTIKFVPDSQIIKVPGTESFPARAVTIRQLEGDWDFNWVGSLQTQDFQIRAQRLDSLLASLGKLGAPLMAMLQAQGKQINWVAIFKRLWRDGMGERGADSIIIDIPTEQQQVDFSALTANRSRGFTGTPGDIQNVLSGQLGQEDFGNEQF